MPALAPTVAEPFARDQATRSADVTRYHEFITIYDCVTATG